MGNRLLNLAWTTSAPLERVWASWTENRHLANWFCDRAEGSITPGGTLTEHWDWFGISSARPVLEVEPMSRLVMGDLTLEFRAASTRRAIKLTDAGCPEDDAGFQSMRSGWLNALALLKEYVERHWDQRKQTLTEFREVELDFTRAIELYRSPLRAQWLPLGDGVLQDTGTEVVLDWPEIEGVLELKAFPWGKGKKLLGMRAVSWSPRDLENRKSELSEAVDRLQRLLS
jgi:hypothetical protein